MQLQQLQQLQQQQQQQLQQQQQQQQGGGGGGGSAPNNNRVSGPNLNLSAPALLFEQQQVKARVAGSPFEDMVVPELATFNSRASIAAAAEELGFSHGRIGSIFQQQQHMKKQLAAATTPKVVAAVAGFAEMLRQTAPPIANTKSMAAVVAAAAAAASSASAPPAALPMQVAAAAAAAATTGTFDDLDSLGLLDGLDTTAAPGSANMVAAVVANANSMQTATTPAGFTGEMNRFFSSSSSSSPSSSTAHATIAEVPEAAAATSPVMDVDAHNSPLATPVFTSAPADSPFGAPPTPLGTARVQSAATAMHTTSASNIARKSGRVAKKTQPFDNSSNASGGAAKSGKGRRAYAGLAVRGTAGKGGKLSASNAYSSYASSSSPSSSSSTSAGKAPPAPITRVPSAPRTTAAAGRKVQPTLAALDDTGALAEDHKPARGRGRQLQLAKMTPAQKKAEAKARLEKNRQAARGFRARRKNHVVELEQQIADYEQRDRDQLNAIRELKQQIARMQQLAGGR